jgi:hypothetical protein
MGIRVPGGRAIRRQKRQGSTSSSTARARAPLFAYASLRAARLPIPIILVDGEACEFVLHQKEAYYNTTSHSYTYTFGLRLSTHATMSNAVGAEDLVPEQTEGFKVGEKKTIDEYQKLGESTILC